MTTRRRRRRPVESRPLTPAEQEAVERQGAYLAWVRTTHPGIGPGLFTHGVCGGSPHTGKNSEAMTFHQGSQGESGQAPRSAAEHEQRDREKAERPSTQGKTI